MENSNDTTHHVRRALDGSLPSLEQVVERLTPLLLAQAQRRIGRVLRGHYDPEDLVQRAWEVCIPKVFPLAIGLERDVRPVEMEPRNGRLTPVVLRYLSSTLLWDTVNLMRKHVDDAPAGGSENQMQLHAFAAKTTAAVNRALRGPLARKFLGCLDRLSDAQRDIVIESGIEGVAYKEIAARLGVSEQALRRRKSDAMRKLRACLDHSLIDELHDD
ncbi:MAG: hypothetical protein GY711_02495 [bacterium]|nr:hypothetical protein [bacterium]